MRPVYHANGAYEMHANPADATQFFGWFGKDATWLHRVVYP